MLSEAKSREGSDTGNNYPFNNYSTLSIQDDTTFHQSPYFIKKLKYV